MSPEILNLKINMHFRRLSPAWHFGGVIHIYALRLPIVIVYMLICKRCVPDQNSNIGILSDLPDIQFFLNLTKTQISLF